MAMFECIQRGIEGGEMEIERAKQAQQLFSTLRENYRAHMGPDADAQAARDVKRIMAARKIRAKRKALLRLQTARRNASQMRAHRTLTGRKNLADVLRLFIEGDATSGITSIAALSKTLRGFYHAELDRVLGEFRRNIVGETRNKARQENVLRVLFDETVDDEAASEMGAATRHVLNRARRDFNSAGGNVGFMEGYGLPMKHDGRRIDEAGFEAWRDFVWDEIDWHRIEDFETEQPFALSPGTTPPRGGRAEQFLEEIFQNIVSDGWSKREASFHQRGLATASRRAERRVLHFKGADSWLRYNQNFGSADVFTTIMTAVDGYARDTAAMRVLGPNPKAGLEFLAQLAQKEAAENPWTKQRHVAVRQARRASQIAKAMLDIHSGSASVPVDERVGNILAGTRALLVSAQLGGAMISAMSDVGFQYMAARELGMSTSPLLGNIFKNLVNDPSASIRMGMIADRWSTAGAAQARYVGEVFTPEVASRFSDATMRLSGLAKWTEAGRHAFQHELMGFLADNTRHSFDEMAQPLRRALERKGFTAREWDLIRQGPLHSEGGATFLVPHLQRYRTDLPAHKADDLAFRLMSFINEQMEFAIPSASLRGQAIGLDTTRPGTLIGELARSGLMYKSFGLSVLFNQASRTMTREGKWSRVGYAGRMMAWMTLMGAISLQAKEIAKGRDPRPMDDAKFLGAAVLQGGGLGIFGDFLASESNRFGGGIAETLSGPVVGGVSDLTQLGISTARLMAGNDDAKPGREAVRFLRYNTPLTGIWYWAQPFQRIMFDELQRWLDPEAERAWRRAERRRHEDYGNASWWRPGSTTPDRGPNLASAFGG